MFQALRYRILFVILAVLTALGADLGQAEAGIFNFGKKAAAKDAAEPQEYNLGELLEGEGPARTWQIEQYNEIMGRLKTGDVLKFTGAEFTVHKILSNDPTATTMVLSIGDGKVLRIPLDFYKLEYIHKYREGARRMMNSRIQAAKVLWDESPPKAPYLVVQEENPLFTLADFLSAKSKAKGASRVLDVDVGKAMAALDRFVLSTYEFSNLSADFIPRQIIYDGEEWIFLDWLSDIDRYIFVVDPIGIGESGFADMFPKELVEKWKSQILELRHSCGAVLGGS